MASSELSFILNNANANLYPSEPGLHSLNFITGFGNNNTLCSWDQVNPQYWSRQSVLEWISCHVEESKYDASLLNLNCCNMDGSALCSLGRMDLLATFGPQLGDTLYQNLETLKHKHAPAVNTIQNFPNMASEAYELLNSFLSDLSGPLLESVIVRDVGADKKESDLSYLNEYKTQLTPSSDHGYDSFPESLQSSHTGSFRCPSSPESAASDSDPEYLESRYTLPMKPCPKQVSTEKKKRGRPPKSSRGAEHYLESKKSKHSPRGTHLWEFIRDILIHPEKNQGLMKWEDRRDGVFKFLKSEAVAQLWGQKKKNSSMTYEKLSRAMRYYYKREILERVDGRRLVYKFGKNSSGWKPEEVGM